MVARRREEVTISQAVGRVALPVRSVGGRACGGVRLVLSKMVVSFCIIALQVYASRLLAQQAPASTSPKPAADAAARARADTIGLLATLAGTLGARLTASESDTSRTATLQHRIAQDSLLTVMRRLGALQAQQSLEDAQLATRASDSAKVLTARLNTLDAQSKDVAVQNQRLSLQLQIEQANKQRREADIRLFSALRTHVTEWRRLGDVAESLSALAQNLLLFPEGGKGFTERLQNLTQWLGFGVAAVGAYVSGSRSAATGAPMATAGLTLSSIMQKLASDDGRIHDLSVNVARNVGFTEEVRSLAQLTPSFSQHAAELEKVLNGASSDTLPSSQQLAQYYSLVSEQRSIYTALSLVAAKGEFLSATFGQLIAPGSKDPLSHLINKAKQTAASWYSDEPALLEPYEHFRLKQEQLTTH